MADLLHPDGQNEGLTFYNVLKTFACVVSNAVRERGGLKQGDLNTSGAHKRLRQFSVLKPEGCEHGSITLNIRTNYRSNAKHNKNRFSHFSVKKSFLLFMH